MLVLLPNDLLVAIFHSFHVLGLKVLTCIVTIGSVMLLAQIVLTLPTLPTLPTLHTLLSSVSDVVGEADTGVVLLLKPLIAVATDVLDGETEEFIV